MHCIYLKGRIRVRARDRQEARKKIFHPLVHSPNGPNPELGESKARRLLQVVHRECREPSICASSVAFPGVLAGSWINRVAGTQAPVL